MTYEKRKITCVYKEDGKITGFNCTPGGRVSRRQVIDQINGSTRVKYFCGSPEAELVVYLSTSPDEVESNNLGELPPCKEAK